MSYTAQKATDLATSSTGLGTIIQSQNDDIVAFETMLGTNVSDKCFWYVAEKGEADGDGYCQYKEMAWCIFSGPLSPGEQTGRYFVMREFAAKDADYSAKDESLYLNMTIARMINSSLENKDLAIGKFDLFLDDFKTFLDGEISTYGS